VDVSTTGLSAAEPYLIAASYALVVGSLTTFLVGLFAKRRAGARLPVALPGVTPDNFVAFSLWAIDVAQIITTALLSPIIEVAKSDGFRPITVLIFVGTAIGSILLCVLLVTHDPVEYVNWAINLIEKKYKSSGTSKKLLIHLVTSVGVTSPVVIQLLAALVAGLTAPSAPHK
jgi:hypothetical protein